LKRVTNHFPGVAGRKGWTGLAPVATKKQNLIARPDEGRGVSKIKEVVGNAKSKEKPTEPPEILKNLGRGNATCPYDKMTRKQIAKKGGGKAKALLSRRKHGGLIQKYNPQKSLNEMTEKRGIP